MHPNSGPRRRHSQELKAKVLAACAEPGASISGVALAHGLNANLVRKWRAGRGTKHQAWQHSHYVGGEQHGDTGVVGRRRRIRRRGDARTVQGRDACSSRT